MKKNRLWLTNILVCFFLLIGGTVYAEESNSDALINAGHTPIQIEKSNEMGTSSEQVNEGKLEDKNTLSARLVSEKDVNPINVDSIQASEDAKKVIEKLNYPSTPGLKSRSASRQGERWGYHDLDKRSNSASRKALYSEIQNAAADFEKSNADVENKIENKNIFASIDLSALGLSETEVVETYKVFTYDHPEHYWLENGLTIIYIDNHPHLLLSVYDEYVLSDVRNKCDTVIQNAMAEYEVLTVRMATNYNKILAVHDKIIKDIDYAYNEAGDSETAVWAHNIMGVFENKSAVCEGYARAFQLIMNHFGIENVYITGYAGEDHAWNMVKLDDGQYYYIDTTFDDQPAFPGGVMYEYFNAPAAPFETGHTAEQSTGTGMDFLYELPAASESDAYTYYRKMNAYAEDGTTDNLEVILDHYVEAAKTVSDLDRSVIAIKTDGNNFQNTFNMLGMYYDMDIEKNALDYYLQEVKNSEGQCIGGGDVTIRADAEHHTLYIALAEQPEMVELYKNGESVGKFKSFTEAYAMLTDGQADYTLKVLTEYAMFPENMPAYDNVRIEGSLFYDGFSIGNEKVYHTSTLYLTKDFTFSKDITFKNLTVEPAFVQYNRRHITLDQCTMRLKGEPTWRRFGTTFSWVSFDEKSESTIIIEGDKQDHSQDQPQNEKNSGGSFNYGRIDISKIKLMEITQLQFSNIIGKIGQIETGAVRNSQDEEIRHSNATVLYNEVNNIEVGSVYISKDAYLTSMVSLDTNAPTMASITGDKNDHIDPNLTFGNWYNKTNQYNQIYLTGFPGAEISTDQININLLGDTIEGDFHVLWNESSEEPWQEKDFVFLKAPALKEENVAFQFNWVHYLTSPKNEKGEFVLSKQIYCDDVKAKDNIIVVEAGQKKKFDFIYYPENHTEKYNEVGYSTLDPQIAEIDEQGFITGKLVGTSDVTAVLGGYIGIEATVKVINGGEIEKLEFLSKPKKQIYYVGDYLQTEGGVLVARYKDGSSEEIPITADICSGYDKNKLGKQRITVAYQNQKNEFEIEMQPTIEDIQSITVKESNTLKNTYYYREDTGRDNIQLEDEKLLVTDVNGQITEIAMSDKSVKIQKNYDFARKICKINIIYKGVGTSFDIPLVSIPMGTTYSVDAPLKTSYKIGEDLNMAGGSLSLYFEDERIQSIPLTDPEVHISGYEKYTTGTQKVNVEYKGFNAPFEVTVSSNIFTLGDVNADKAINASDALLALRHSVKEITLESDQFTRADVTKDKMVNASDALQILRYSVKEIESFD
ncbi:MAG: hypothetical protein EUB_01660 [Eubacterium sp.]|uniref:bacterial Ig-like domain-containing protein n=1 Tax=Eubacterium sp. TaxID=142586 RepID=UPI00304E54D2